MLNRPDRAIVVSLTLLLSLTLVALSACSRDPDVVPPPSSGAAADPLVLVRDAAGALKSIANVEFDFAYGHRDDPTGWVTGRTRMHRVSDPADSWIRVTGTVHPQPRFNVRRVDFDYGLDGATARLVHHTEKTYEEVAAGRGSNRLAWNAIYGYITEFVESEPFWKELRTARRAAHLGTESIGGVECDVVQTIQDVGQGEPMEVRWSLGRDDHLPRRGRWISSQARPDGVVFTMTSLRAPDRLEPDDFRPAAPDGYRRVESPSVPGVGQPAPAWELPQPDGTLVRSADLRGAVVVLDFWNTWCYQCRAMAPATRALEREFDGRRVRFFGVNLFETGDPIAYWKEGRFPYTLLLKGDQVAARFDVITQPAIVVVGADGRLLYSQLGATHDRSERVGQAIRAGLLALERG